MRPSGQREVLHVVKEHWGGRLRHMKVAGVNAILLLVPQDMVGKLPHWIPQYKADMVAKGYKRTSSSPVKRGVRWKVEQARLMMRPMYRCMDGATRFGLCKPKDVCLLESLGTHISILVPTVRKQVRKDA